MAWIFVLAFIGAYCILNIQCFTVDVVNITECSEFDQEKGALLWDIGSEETADQLFTGVFHIPTKLDESTLVDYESYYFDEEKDEWIFMFAGMRSLCNSVLKSLNYHKFRTSVDPNWPEDCPIPADKYELVDFPISGQYAALSDIRNVPPLLKHQLSLWGDDDLILCRVIYTISNN